MNLKTTLNLYICIVTLFLLCECNTEKGIERRFIQFDIIASYPEKECNLEDIAEIEYFQFGVNEDFLFSGDPSIITEEKVVFSNSNDDILFFSRNGKPLSKFNRRGNGPKEYPYTTGGHIYDENSDDLFVRTHNMIMVYSSTGDFKRSLPLPEGASLYQIVNFDSKALLIYDEEDFFPAPFTFISKENGSVVETINIPMGKKLNLQVSVGVGDNFTVFFRPHISSIVRYNNGYLLSDASNDTIYYYSQKKELFPILVRNPKIHSMNPIITLSSFVEAGNYQFMCTTKVVQVKFEDGGLPKTYLMRDKQTGSVYRQKITLNEYPGKVINISDETIRVTQDSKLGLIVFSLVELQDAYRENRINGRLKKMVENSDENGNNIYMFLHFKN